MAETFEKRPRTGGDYAPLGTGELIDHDDRGLRVSAGSTTVEVAALAPDLFRVGMFPAGGPPRYDSEAIAKEDWGPVEVSMQESDDELTLSTTEATARVSSNPLRIGFVDPSGREFAVDDEELGMGAVETPGADVFSEPLGSPVRLYKRRESGERYFGCGERTSGLEKTGSHQIVYYVFCGPTPRDVVDRYTELTGRTPMPPLWSLGNQQCRYSYMNEEEVREIASGFRERDIPCDVIYLDIHYMDGYRVFTWNEDRFPDPQGLISDLSEQGFRVVTIVDPGVKVDENYSIYTEGRARDLYCKTRDGEEYHNAVWPGVCAFPDFTNPETREWWGGNQKILTDEGVAGIWCDMNEPALFVPAGATMPDNVVHPGGRTGEARWHAQIHNTYGSLMARAAREGLLSLRPDERPFVITRAGYAGLQRHAMQWTGDNSSWWEHLWMSMPQLQNLALSGVAWAGVDVGGFGGDTNGELLARWTEFGVFQPYCRNHTTIGPRRQEPWAFGEPYESVCREMIKLRQRLLPYIYSLFEVCHRTGAPILRPLLFEYPEDKTTYTADDEFLLGDALLVAPITRPGIEHRHVYLPEGTWFHYYSDERFEGPDHILAHAPLGEPALYVKADSPIPMGPDASHTKERPDDPLTLLVYPAEGKGESIFYEDVGNGFGYERGEYARRRISCESSDERIIIRFGERQGSLVTERREIMLELRGISTAQGVIVNDEESTPVRIEGGVLTVELGEEAGPTTVEVIL